MKNLKIGDLTSYVTAMNLEAKPESAVIVVHGYGANGQDLLALGQAWQAAMPTTIFIAPDAPSACNGMPFGFEWFPITDLQRETMERDIGNAWQTLDHYIDAVKDMYALDDSNIILCGFSQGTMMSLHTALLRDKQLAGVLGYSGMLLHNTLPETLPHTSMPIHLIHGDDDNVVPASMWNDAMTVLKSKGFNVEGRTVKGLGHGIDEAGLVEGLQFIQGCLSSSRTD